MALPPRILDLRSLSVLKNLPNVAQKHSTELRVFGGAVARIWMLETCRTERQLSGFSYDLFDITPFNSDVDIWHLADKDRSFEIKKNILESVPFAPWCRWALQSKEEGLTTQQNRATSTQVPLRMLYLSTSQRTTISDEAYRDISDRKVTFERNPEFRKGALAKSIKDVEFFGLLLALNVLVDMKEILGTSELRNKSEALSWLKEERTRADIRLAAQHPILKLRFWSMLSSLLAKGAPETEEFVDLILSQVRAVDPDHPFLIQNDVGSRHSTCLSSKPIDYWKFRVPELSPAVRVGQDAQIVANRILKKFPVFRESKFDPAFRVVGAVERLRIDTVKSTNENTGLELDPAYASWSLDEFIQISWDPGPQFQDDLDPRSLTAAIFPYDQELSETVGQTAAVGGSFTNGRRWIRFDTDHLLQRFKSSGELFIDIVILQSLKAAV
ncbi:hypothetical protein [Martelella radicis]|uniref:Uncharacterized protein n=1 Tax=Martelella radicis TaxID=1397476 RepID=A0A7W6KHS0_9HYPH|nr:hypothetical protein [Martelella radicis]MBB4121544.1 hypothetical protein [Martelella radicis]